MSADGVIMASGRNEDVGNWAANVRVRAEPGTTGHCSTTRLRVPQFHKMHDYAVGAINSRYQILKQEDRAMEFDYGLADFDMDAANVALLQV